MEEKMSQGNAVLALYAAFAGFLLALGIASKLWVEHRENREAPRLKFDAQPQAKKAPKEQSLVASR